MQQQCHGCGGDLPADRSESPFCPHCGTPQLFLAMENQSVETGGEPALAADGSASTGRMPPPRPQQVVWKTAIRCAAGVAAVAGVLTVAAVRVDVLSPVCTVWVMFASLITVSFYRKQQPAAWIDVSVGARIGLLVGVCLAVGISVALSGWWLVERFGLHAMGGFDAAMAGVVQQGIQRSPTPMQPDQLGLMKSPEVRAGLVLATFAMVSVCLLLMSALGGAFAGLLRMRRGRMA
jgi:hypothetical protein